MTDADRTSGPTSTGAPGGSEPSLVPQQLAAYAAAEAHLGAAALASWHAPEPASLLQAAALAAAGPASRLALPRIASGGATCALAAPWSGEAP